MPLSRRTSAKSLRRCRSVASNILRGSRPDHHPPPSLDAEASHRDALAAATRAFGGMPAHSPGATAPSRLQRSQSVRFARPPAGTSQGNRRADRWTEINATAPLSPLTLSEPSPGDSPLTALPAVVHKASGPVSSFRRLKKARSSQSPRANAAAFFAHHPSSSSLAEASLRSTPRSARFPTGATPGRTPPTAEEILLRLPNPYQSTYSQAEAIQLARDEYVRQLEAAGRARPSFVSARTLRAPPKTFRRTVRSSSATSFGDGVASDGCAPAPRQSKAAAASRKISGSIKGKLRRFFGGAAQPAMPSQHVAASREHYDRAGTDIPAPPRNLVEQNRERSGSPYLPGHVSQCDGDASRSVRSRRSDDEPAGSRSSSWGNSTASKDTAAAAHPVTSRQRLSVIQENLPHQPSSSAGRVPGSGYSAFRKPMRAGRGSEPIDAERVVSALKKRMEERRHAQEPDDQAELARARSSASLRSRCTIRMVSPEPELPQLARLRDARNFDVEANEADDVFQPVRPVRHVRVNAGAGPKLSFQNIADLNESHRHGAVAQENRATFFPGKRQFPAYRASPLKSSMRATVEHAARPRTPADDPLLGSSDSAYSRKTTGTPVGRRRERDQEHGTACIIDTNPMVSHYRKIVSRAQSRSASDRSAGSWKGWMSSEVSKLECDGAAGAQLAPNWSYKGLGHVRERAQIDPDDAGTRKASGPKNLLGLARRISGTAKRKASGQGAAPAQPQPAAAPRKSSLSERRKALLEGLRAASDENKRPQAAAAAASGRQLASSLSHHRLEPPALSAIEESPLTPFSKFMATDDSPRRGSPPLARPAMALGSRRSVDRELRLQDYRGGPGLAERPSPNAGYVPDGLEPRPLSRANRTVDLFLSRQQERSASPTSAFI